MENALLISRDGGLLRLCGSIGKSMVDRELLLLLQLICGVLVMSTAHRWLRSESADQSVTGVSLVHWPL